MLIAVLIIALISGVVGGLLIALSRFYFTEMVKTELQQKGNRSITLLVTELRDAQSQGTDILTFTHDSNGNCIIDAFLPYDVNDDDSLWNLACDEEGRHCDFNIEYDAAGQMQYMVDMTTNQLQRVYTNGVALVLCNNVRTFMCAEPVGDANQYDEGEMLSLRLELSKEIPYLGQTAEIILEDGVWLVNSL